MSENVNQSKPKSNLKKYAAIGIGLLVLFCCGIFALAALLGPTSDGESTAVTVVGESTEVEVAAAIASQEEPVVPASTDIPVPTNTPAPTNTPVPTRTPAPTRTPDPNLVRVGTHIVGVDIQPGLYRGEAGLGMFDSCYWARLKDLTGTLDAILANEIAIGQFYVEVKPTDYAFETRCQIVRFEPPTSVDTFATQLDPGMYLVGVDIQPGTYRGDAGEDISESCYWARLKEVTGTLDAILANEIATGLFYVEVRATDYALETRCELSLVE
jgi:hypothetical protein